MFKIIILRPADGEQDMFKTLITRLGEGYKIINATPVDEYVIYILERKAHA